MELLLLHTGKAYLPELRAYRRAFEPHFDVRTATMGQLHGRSHPGRILWFFMGFHPGRYEAEMVVHDYRSLSVGAYSGLKDVLKRRLHAKPDLRVFANEVIEREMGFRDDVPSCLLDMGVHLDLIPERRTGQTFEYDFCYAGDISRERGAEAWLREFVKRANGRRLALAGNADHRLWTRYRDAPEFEFLGRLSLEDTYDLMSRSETGICYLPNRRPYVFQTPVKVLEYAALGLKVVVNETASNIQTLRKFGIEGLVMPDFEFPTREAVEQLADHCAFDADPIGWSRVIERSMVIDRLLGIVQGSRPVGEREGESFDPGVSG